MAANLSSIEGKRVHYIVGSGCNGCRLCEFLAVNNFGQVKGSGRYVVVKQPETWEEEEQCQEALDRCHRRVIRQEIASELFNSRVSFDGALS